MLSKCQHMMMTVAMTVMISTINQAWNTGKRYFIQPSLCARQHPCSSISNSTTRWYLFQILHLSGDTWLILIGGVWVKVRCEISTSWPLNISVPSLRTPFPTHQVNAGEDKVSEVGGRFHRSAGPWLHGIPLLTLHGCDNSKRSTVLGWSHWALRKEILAIWRSFRKSSAPVTSLTYSISVNCGAQNQNEMKRNEIKQNKIPGQAWYPDFWISQCRYQKPFFNVPSGKSKKSICCMIFGNHWLYINLRWRRPSLILGC